MPPKVYIPLIVSGRDKYQYHVTSCGCFRTRETSYKFVCLLFG